MPKINQRAEKVPFYLTKKVSEGVVSEPDAVNLSRGQAGFLSSPKIYEESKRINEYAIQGINRVEQKFSSKQHLKKLVEIYNYSHD